MKIYTKTGDDGTTGLFGGERVGKDHPRVAAYGAVDELNAAIGLALEAMKGGGSASDMLASIQAELFSLGAELATPDPAKQTVRVSDGDVARLEGWIDQVEDGLPQLRTFILPGGSEAGARLHYARTVCRRAERSIVSLAEVEKSGDLLRPQIVTYVNRLGDLLFSLARQANVRAGVAEVPWKPPATS